MITPELTPKEAQAVAARKVEEEVIRNTLGTRRERTIAAIDTVAREIGAQREAVAQAVFTVGQRSTEPVVLSYSAALDVRDGLV